MNNARQVLDLAKRVFLLMITAVNELLHFEYFEAKGNFPGLRETQMSQRISEKSVGASVLYEDLKEAYICYSINSEKLSLFSEKRIHNYLSITFVDNWKYQ